MLRHQRTVVTVQQISRRSVDRFRRNAEQELSFFRVERCEVNSVGLRLHIGSKVDVMTAVRKEMRPHVRRFAAGSIQCCQIRDNASRRGDLLQWSAWWKVG